MNKQTPDQRYAPTPYTERTTPASDLQPQDFIDVDRKNLLVREVRPLDTGQLRIITLLGCIDADPNTLFKRINR